MFLTVIWGVICRRDWLPASPYSYAPPSSILPPYIDQYKIVFDANYSIKRRI